MVEPLTGSVEENFKARLMDDEEVEQAAKERDEEDEDADR